MMPETYKLYDDNIKLYSSMIKDIETAKKSILLETYRFNADMIGSKFRDAITKAAKKGVKVKLLIDAWGSSSNDFFFRKLILYGGEVRFFRRFKFKLKWFDYNHRRDHRKILIIDGKIAYIGSTNIADESITWRETNLRITGRLAKKLIKAFNDNYEIHSALIFDPKKHIYPIRQGNFEIIRDVPSFIHQNVRDEEVLLFKKAKKEIIIETPYFIPDRQIRKSLKRAAKRGIKVKIILPARSDVRIMDLLRDQFLGKLHRRGVRIYYYQPTISHAKAVIVDNKYFLLGSSNLDFRSFIHQYEIMLLGSEKKIINQLKKHFQESLNDSEPFSYRKWKRRPLLQKIFETISSPFKNLF